MFVRSIQNQDALKLEDKCGCSAASVHQMALPCPIPIQSNPTPDAASLNCQRNEFELHYEVIYIKGFVYALSPTNGKYSHCVKVSGSNIG